MYKRQLVLDGFVRNIPDQRGDPAEVHQWAAPLPAWIELRWQTPQRLGKVQVTFDTGFKRQLTLSAQETQNINLLRAPQPETVRDYRVVALLPNGSERTLATVNANFQRLNRHRFEPVDVASLRLEVMATNGDPMARVFEIRCYA